MNTVTRTWIGNIPGYCEGLPSGAYIFNLPGVGVDTPQALLPLPGDNTSATFCRISEDGRKIICQGQEDNAAWVWDGRWEKTGQLVWGTDGTIFGQNDVPAVNDSQLKWQETGGLRWLRSDGLIINCSLTYYDGSRELFQYTDYGDVAIGQGGKSYGQGVVVWVRNDNELPNGTMRYPPVLRRFCTQGGQKVLGTLRNVHVRRRFDNFAVSMCNYDTRTASVTQCTLAELLALPFAAVIPPQPEPPKPEPPKPEPPKPEPPKPIPPIPPKPEPPKAFRAATPMRLQMDKTVAFRAGKFFGRIDPASATTPTNPTTPWQGWFPVKFDRTDPADPDCRFQLTQTGDRLKAKHLTTGALLSIDFTEFGGGVCNGFYGKPGGDQGGYEQLQGWTLDGSNVVVVPYERDGQKYVSPSLTVVEL